jgi:tRNA pseudouridine13 synthase
VRLRESPEDFRVEEIPLYPPSGEGEHTFVRVEKRLRTTGEVARDLARAAGVEPRDVGFAGRKDRVAVAIQWFSVPGLDPSRALGLELAGARVLEAERHRHKLRTAHLRGNRFRIAVRDVDAAALATAQEGLLRLGRSGMPNRFGEQRFGRDGDNVAQARRLLTGETLDIDRRGARFLLSALQAAVFNQVLAERGERIDRVERGDIAVVHATGGLFRVEDPEAEAPRATAFEISPTGPIFGTRMPAPAGEAAERERAVLLEHGVTLEGLRLPRGVRLRGARRALRVRPEAASARAIDRGIELRFELPPGSYATVLVEEILGTHQRSHDMGARPVILNP